MASRMRWATMAAALGLAVLSAGAGAQETKMTAEELLRGADERIERHRKSDVSLRVTDWEGRPVVGARVDVEQVRHEFLFGCNLFQLFSYQGKQHEDYASRFEALLNYATLPFYWGSYEREPGKEQTAELERMARWCRDRGIATKGHPLVWHEVYPRWAPSDPDEAKARLKDRVSRIVSHFRGLIDRWDVVNEATVSARFDNGFGRWVKRDGAAASVGEALSWARAANPEAVLLYNDYNVSRDFERLVGDLLRANRPVDVIGIQSHMHTAEWPLERAWEVCETYKRFGKPIHFTELTVLSGVNGWERKEPWPSTPEGEAKQADYVEKLYTLLFSHPAVEAITWWDLMDGGWQNAPAGLLRADLTPKPAYERLMKLVKGKWWTRERLRTDSGGRARTRGFRGTYRVTVTTPTETKTATLVLGESDADWTIRLR